MSTKVSTILIVDDHPLLRTGVAQLLAEMTGVRVIGEAGDAAEARAAVDKFHPDLVLLDMMLKHEDGLELLKEWHATNPDLKVLVLSMMDESTYAERALNAGAQGYIMKEEGPGDLQTAVQTVLEGNIYVSHRISTKLLGRKIGRRGNGADKSGGVAALTDRELHIYRLIGLGMTTREIASDLNLSVKTVETHKQNIKCKMGARNAVDLNRMATLWVVGQ